MKLNNDSKLSVIFFTLGVVMVVVIMSFGSKISNIEYKPYERVFNHPSGYETISSLEQFKKVLNSTGTHLIQVHTGRILGCTAFDSLNISGNKYSMNLEEDHEFAKWLIYNHIDKLPEFPGLMIIKDGKMVEKFDSDIYDRTVLKCREIQEIVDKL